MQTSTKSEGKRKFPFSFSRMTQNMFPGIVQSGLATFSSAQLDGLFDFQVSLQSPSQKLLPASIYLSGIVQTEKMAAITHAKLVKMGALLSEAPWINTDKVINNSPNQLTILPVNAQKSLVCLLFDWEEEIKRWKVLEEEEVEIRMVISEVKSVGGNVGHLEKRLMEIKGLKNLKPSLREARAATGAPSADELPAYEDTGVSGPLYSR